MEFINFNIKSCFFYHNFKYHFEKIFFLNEVYNIVFNYQLLHIAVLSENPEIVKIILSEKDIDVNANSIFKSINYSLYFQNHYFNTI